MLWAVKVGLRNLTDSPTYTLANFERGTTGKLPLTTTAAIDHLTRLQKMVNSKQVSTAPASGELGSLDWFKSLKATEMSNKLKDLKDSGNKLVKSVTGKKDVLIARYAALIEAAKSKSTINEPGDSNDESADTDNDGAGDESVPDAGALAAAKGRLASQLLSETTFVSASTLDLLSKLHYKNNFSQKDEDDDLTEDLKQVNQVVEYLATLLDGGLSTESDHTANLVLLRTELKNKFPTFTTDSVLFVEFFENLGLDVKAPESNEDTMLQMAIEASLAASGDAAATTQVAIKQELEVLRVAISVVLLRWVETFPEPDPEEAIFPDDFDAGTDRKTFKKWMETALADWEEEHGEGSALDKNMPPEDTDALIGELLATAKDFPFANNKGRNRTAMLACLKDVRGRRAASEGRARSKSQTPAPGKSKSQTVDDEDEADSSERSKTRKSKAQGSATKGKAAATKGKKRSRESGGDSTEALTKRPRSSRRKSNAIVISDDEEED